MSIITSIINTPDAGVKVNGIYTATEHSKLIKPSQRIEVVSEDKPKDGRLWIPLFDKGVLPKYRWQLMD